MFSHSADCLLDFFSLAGRAFYIPYYQRQYSWDSSNAGKLIDDIFHGLMKACEKPDYIVFLGTIILHGEDTPRVGTHYDTLNLITKISNVVDGQQRISSLAMLAGALTERAEEFSESLKSIADAGELAQQYKDCLLEIAGDLSNQSKSLQNLYSIQVNKVNVSPERKPIVIRAQNHLASPKTDQWTLRGPVSSFYRSDVAKVLVHIIEHKRLPNLNSLDSPKLKEVLSTFQKRLKSEFSDPTDKIINGVCSSNSLTSSVLYNLFSVEFNLQDVQANLGDDEFSLFRGAVLCLAVMQFFQKACHVVAVEAKSESLAFDMFQSLNATGTPLTAFEVFKPLIVNKWEQAYANSGAAKEQVDRAEKVFDQEEKAIEKEERTDSVIRRAALVFNGKELGRHFSEKRDWLVKSFDDLYSTQQSALPTLLLLKCIADQAEYDDKIVHPKKPARGTTNFPLVAHLSLLGMGVPEADLCALCIYVLKDANHKMAHVVMSVFYSKLLEAHRGGPVCLDRIC